MSFVTLDCALCYIALYYKFNGSSRSKCIFNMKESFFFQMKIKSMSIVITKKKAYKNCRNHLSK